MEKFISCDWGSSALRLRVVDATTESVLTESATDKGIVPISDFWKKKGKNENERIAFYQSFLTEQIILLEKQLNTSLENCPVIISGMASSNIGMKELPYKKTPFAANENDLVVHQIESSENFKHEIILISGVRTDDDVMRGEETQLIGCLKASDQQDGFFIFPGTHSKHIELEKGLIKDLKTYMTGEFFELLSKKSILSNTVEENDDLSNADNVKSFEAGVVDGLQLNILRAAFLVRTNQLLAKRSKKENYFYLSGLLIGAEIKDLNLVKKQITVIVDQRLMQFYKIALSKIGVTDAEYINACDAVVAGHCKIYKLYGQEGA
jgi:2-dehydro-3-deoxygalactonokinase